MNMSLINAKEGKEYIIQQINTVPEGQPIFKLTSP